MMSDGWCRWKVTKQHPKHTCYNLTIIHRYRYCDSALMKKINSSRNIGICTQLNEGNRVIFFLWFVPKILQGGRFIIDHTWKAEARRFANLHWLIVITIITIFTSFSCLGTRINFVYWAVLDCAGFQMYWETLTYHISEWG